MGAYLNGDLEEEIYMEQPEGFEDGTTKKARLHRTLYGLKQSGRVWNAKLHTRLTAKGFTRLNAEFCIYVKHADNKPQVVAVWVDDLFLFTSDKTTMVELKKVINEEFNAKDLGEASYGLGMEIQRDRSERKLMISQKRYIKNILKKRGMEDCNPVATPLEHLCTPNQASEPADPKVVSLYASEIGSLMYLTVGTRADLSFTINHLAQFSHNPAKQHWDALKRIYRYLKGTVDYGLTYGGPEIDWGTEFTAFADSDWGTMETSAKSTSGYVFLLAGGAICWSSKKQTTIAMSTTEAEYYAGTHCTKHLIWLRYLMDELGYTQPDQSVLHMDNSGAIALAKNPEFHARTKHIHRAHHFLREKVAEGVLDLVHIPTSENCSDIFTKPLERVKHDLFTREIGLLPD